jgi:hypothetical protein
MSGPTLHQDIYQLSLDALSLLMYQPQCQRVMSLSPPGRFLQQHIQ